MGYEWRQPEARAAHNRVEIDEDPRKTRNASNDSRAQMTSGFIRMGTEGERLMSKSRNRDWEAGLEYSGSSSGVQNSGLRAGGSALSGGEHNASVEIKGEALASNHPPPTKKTKKNSHILTRREASSGSPEYGELGRIYLAAGKRYWSVESRGKRVSSSLIEEGGPSTFLKRREPQTIKSQLRLY